MKIFLATTNYKKNDDLYFGHGVDMQYIQANNLAEAEAIYEKYLAKMGYIPNSTFAVKGYVVNEVVAKSEEELLKM